MIGVRRSVCFPPDPHSTPSQAARPMLDRTRLPPALPARFLAAAALALASCGAGGNPPAENLLLITVDTLRADHLGCYGYGRATSPNLDAFAAGATLFDAAQAQSSWTLPSLASLMTSVYPSTHGLWRHSSQLDPTFTTLAEVLRNAGFDTAAIVSNHLLGRPYGLHQGFTRYGDELASAAVRPDLYQAITSAALSDEAVRWLESKAAADADPPWFLWLHYFDPHREYRAHPGTTTIEGSAELDRYDAEIAFTDAQIGRVLAALADTGLDRRTAVMFASDHGEEFGDHGGSDHGHTLYQELVRVPLLIRAPGFRARRVPDGVGLIDVAPTALELLGLAPHPDFAGRSLVAALQGENLEERAVLAELRLADGRRERSLRLGRWKAVTREGEPARLYDLATDPGERDDRSAREPGRAAALVRRLEGLVQEAGEEASRYRRAPPLDPAPLEALALHELGYLGEGSRER